MPLLQQAEPTATPTSGGSPCSRRPACLATGISKKSRGDICRPRVPVLDVKFSEIFLSPSKACILVSRKVSLPKCRVSLLPVPLRQKSSLIRSVIWDIVHQTTVKAKAMRLVDPVHSGLQIKQQPKKKVEYWGNLNRPVRWAFPPDTSAGGNAVSRTGVIYCPEDGELGDYQLGSVVLSDSCIGDGVVVVEDLKPVQRSRYEFASHWFEYDQYELRSTSKKTIDVSTVAASFAIKVGNAYAGNDISERWVMKMDQECTMQARIKWIQGKMKGHHKWYAQWQSESELEKLDADLNMTTGMSSVETSWATSSVETSSVETSWPSEEMLAVLQRAEVRRPVMTAVAETARREACVERATDVAKRKEMQAERRERKKARKQELCKRTKGSKLHVTPTHTSFGNGSGDGGSSLTCTPKRKQPVTSPMKSSRKRVNGEGENMSALLDSLRTAMRRFVSSSPKCRDGAAMMAMAIQHACSRVLDPTKKTWDATAKAAQDAVNCIVKSGQHEAAIVATSTRHDALATQLKEVKTLNDVWGYDVDGLKHRHFEATLNKELLDVGLYGYM